MSRPMSYKVAEQLDHAYRAMAREARYRPGAPSDGFGNITVPAAELDMEAEIAGYAQSWWKDEDRLEFFIGCCNFDTREATIFAVEAARTLCGAQDDRLALRLLEMAADSLRERMGAEVNSP